MVAGGAYAFVGLSFFTTNDSKNRLRTLALAIRWMPLEAWGAVFIFAGVLAIISSRWPPISETWGYTVLTGLSTGWSGVYLMGYFFYKAPITALSGAIVWGLMGFMWWAVSGLINPHALLTVLSDGDHTG